LELINKFSKVAGYKIIIPKSFVFYIIGLLNVLLKVLAEYYEILPYIKLAILKPFTPSILSIKENMHGPHFRV